MGDTDTDAADRFDASISDQRLDEGGTATPLWRRYGRLPRNVFAIGLVSLLNDASSEIIYPLLPLFLSVTLGASPAVIGLIEGAAESVSSLLKLFAGYFSDRRAKRKGLVVFGYTLASVARPLLAFASSWYQVFIVRLSDRVGKGIRTAPRDAMIADAALPEERGLAFGFHRAMDHAGAVIGPLLGYLLLYFIAANRNAPTAGDYKRVFLFASIPALAAVLVAALAVRETKIKSETSASYLEPVRLSLSGFSGNFKIFLVLVALFTLSNSTDAFLILRAGDAGISTATIPLLWAALHLSKVLSSLIGGNLSDRLGRKFLIASGWLLYAVVYAGFAYVSSPGMAWALFLIYGVYFGLAEGAEKALVADLVRPEQRGTAYGLYNLAFGITVFPASLLMGLLWNWRGAHAAFLVSACIGASAALLLILTVRARDEESLAV
ncbi:MAG TPA: MFS transporter [Pyrinomonadaceae bacterium]|jgi:MFS family permease|nr:MFS transporter [Pyrinomonadaceae bacterium]